MKTRITILAIITTCLFGCSQSTTTEGRISECFEKYVETDFGNTKDFKEITSINLIDSLDKTKMLSLCQTIDECSSILTPLQIIKASTFRMRFEQDTNVLKTYEIKVRMIENKHSVVNIFYAIDHNGNINIQDHKLHIDETPELYKDFFEFAKELTK